MTKPASVWETTGTKLLVAVIAPMIVTMLLSIFTWVAFRATVVERLDSLSTTVQEIRHGMVSKDYVDESLRGLNERLAADERDITLIRQQLHDDETRKR